jgi:hypothetical protein
MSHASCCHSALQCCRGDSAQSVARAGSHRGLLVRHPNSGWSTRLRGAMEVEAPNYTASPWAVRGLPRLAQASPDVVDAGITVLESLRLGRRVYACT